MNKEKIGGEIVDNLREVYDPEISINVYDLGLIYDIDLEHLPKVAVTHTLTSAFCPFADDIIADITHATDKVDGVDTVEIITTFVPPFGPDMMSEETKMILGIWDQTMKWIKQIFGIKPSEDIIITDDRFKNATPTNELVISANNNQQTMTSNDMSPANLKKMTKSQLEELAKSELGIELDKRDLKANLIKQILDAK